MTPQEAIRWLEAIINKYIHGGDEEFDEKRKQAIKTAISALEKQIPKKPNIHGYREGREVNTISYTCPICNKHIGRDAYCKHCGQALDWGDSE